MPFEPFLRYGPGEGENARAQTVGFSDNQLQWGDVAAPGWFNQDAKSRFRSGNPYYVDVPGAPPGPYNGQYRVSDWSMWNSNTPTNQWELWVPPGGLPQRPTSSPGSVTDNPFQGGMPQADPPTPGEITDNPFMGDTPPANVAPNDLSNPTTSGYRFDNPPPNESGGIPTPITAPVNVPPNEASVPDTSGINYVPNPAGGYWTYDQNWNYSGTSDTWQNPAPNDAQPLPFTDTYPGSIVNPTPNDFANPTAQGFRFDNPAPNDNSILPVGNTYRVDPSNPAPNEDVAPPTDNIYRPEDAPTPPGVEPDVAPADQLTPNPPYPGYPGVTFNNSNTGPLYASPQGMGWGGFGQPMGYFPWAGQGPIGAFGVGGAGGSFFSGSDPSSPMTFDSSAVAANIPLPGGDYSGFGAGSNAGDIGAWYAGASPTGLGAHGDYSNTDVGAYWGGGGGGRNSSHS